MTTSDKLPRGWSKKIWVIIERSDIPDLKKKQLRRLIELLEEKDRLYVKLVKVMGEQLQIARKPVTLMN